jgi:hypothetical protein
VTVPTYTDLLAQTPPWYVAHRGNGGYHPEHTLIAYYLSFLSVPSGSVPAVEVSVRRTADNQMICMHDQALTRTTTDTANVEDRHFPYLRNSQAVDIGGGPGVGVNGPGWDDQPIPLLGDVLDAIGNKAVLFLEPKAADATSINLIFALLDKYAIDPASIVWKFNRSGGGGVPAHAVSAGARGHALWAYLNLSDASGVVDATATGLTTNAPTGGALIGVQVEETDPNIAYVVGKGLDAVVSWEVHRRSERDRLNGLSVPGMMTPQEHYLRGIVVNGSTQWSTGFREPGQIPKTKDDWINTGGVISTDWLTVPAANGSILLGSISPGSGIASTYTADYRMKWDTLPSATLHSDFIFAELDDRAYGHQASTNAGGYHVVFRVNGDLQLFKHVNGSTTGTQLGSTSSTTAPSAAQELRFQVSVTSTTLSVQRVDPTTAVAIGSAVTSSDTTYRGGYFHIAKASADQTPAFKFVIVT